MTVKIIVAAALNGAIGRNNDLMWHISGDLRFFKATTMGHPVIMGRKTFESIGRALPGRRNIVVSRGEPQLPQGVELAHSLEEALGMLEGTEPFVLGGGQIYAQAMKYASELYLTRVFCCPDDADTFFPPITADEWEIVSTSDVETDEKSGLNYSFERYKKI